MDNEGDGKSGWKYFLRRFSEFESFGEIWFVNILIQGFLICD